MWDEIFAILACYRIAHMMVAEDGMFGMFTHWRGWLFSKFGQESWAYQGFTCVLCLTFWLSWPAALFVWPGLVLYPIYALGIACACLLIHKIVLLINKVLYGHQ